MSMSEQEREAWLDVHYRMDGEGMWYCFEGYSSFEEIDDPEFHRLREDFLGAGQALRDYVNAKKEEADG